MTDTITIPHAVYEQVLEALNNITDYDGLAEARRALRAAREQPQRTAADTRFEYNARRAEELMRTEVRIEAFERTAADAGYTDIVSDGGMDPRNALEEPQEWLTGCPECGMDGGCDCESGTWNPPVQPQQVIEHYEAALKAAFPEGAQGAVYEHWNEARRLQQEIKP